MRGLLLFITLLALSGLLLLAACPRSGSSGSTAGGGWSPGDGLPPDWPVRELTLPTGATVFEGHVDTTQDGGKSVTVFYTSGGGWDAQVADIEGKLGKLKYRRMPPGLADGAGGQHQTWISPAGKLVVLLLYDEDPQAAEKLSQPGYYTLVARTLKAVQAVDPAWEELK